VTIRKLQTHRRARAVFGLTLLALFAFCGLAAGSAGAAQFSFAFGEKGSGNGQFIEPDGVAVASGITWVVDSGNSRIEKFNSEGGYLGQFGEKGSGNGQLQYPTDIDVDSAGNLWVLDSGNKRVEKFNSKGEYLAQFETVEGGGGLALDPSGGFWVSLFGNCLAKFGVKSQGELLALQCAGSSLGGVVVDASGNPWATDSVGNSVLKFNSKGEYMSQFGSKGSGNGQLNGPTDLAFDASGNIWVVDYGNSRVEKFNSKGEYMSQFGAAGSGTGQFKHPRRLAIASNGDLWVADEGNHRVQKWLPSRPVATTEAATSVTAHTANLHATVNPSGFSTTYYFAYGSELTAKVSAGSGTSNVKVSQEIVGLKPSTTYHFRVVASNSEGIEVGKEETFTTPSAAGTQHWHACTEGWGSTNYSDSACTKETLAGLGSFGLHKFTEGSSQGVSVSASSGFTLAWNMSGLQFNLNCSTESSEASTAKNPSGGGAGTFAGHLAFSGCSFGGSYECSLSGSPLTMTLSGVATEFEGKPAVRFTSSTGGEAIFAITTPKGCPYENTFTFYGEFTGVMNSQNELEFTAAGSKLSVYGSYPATFTGVSKLKTEAGDQVVVTP
jgi:streptogramin lyase